MATKRNVFVYDGRVMLLDDPILVAGMEQLGHTTAEDFYCYLEMCFEVPRPGQFLLKLDEMVVLPRDDAILPKGSYTVASRGILLSRKSFRAIYFPPVLGAILSRAIVLPLSPLFIHSPHVVRRLTCGTR